MIALDEARFFFFLFNKGHRWEGKNCRSERWMVPRMNLDLAAVSPLFFFWKSKTLTGEKISWNSNCVANAGIIGDAIDVQISRSQIWVVITETMGVANRWTNISETMKGCRGDFRQNPTKGRHYKEVAGLGFERQGRDMREEGSTMERRLWRCEAGDANNSRSKMNQC